MMQRCGLCRFYSPFFIQEEGSDAKPSISIAGECRRFPGVIEVDENKWCGEFKSATAAKKAAAFDFMLWATSKDYVKKTVDLDPTGSSTPPAARVGAPAAVASALLQQQSFVLPFC